MTCGHCGAANADGHAFCSACGKKLVEACGACGAALAPGARFCTGCGAAVAGAARSVVADGVWVRDPSELVWRVSRDELRSVFGDLDGWLAGRLVGRLMEVVGSRSVRVPLGSTAALVRDGRVVRLLPPGEQVTAGVLRDLLRDAAERFASVERASLYLVDLRPVPVGFTREVAIAGTLRTIQVGATFRAGATAEELGAFLASVVRDRDHLAAAELHSRLRPELETAVDDALRAHASDLRQAERAARAALEARALAGTGLRVDLALARKGTLHRVDLALGGAAVAPAACAACRAPLGAGQRFCTACGARAPEADAASLATSDATAVIVDLVAELRGDAAPTLPSDALMAAARAHLRGVAFADLVTPAGFAALAEALAAAASGPLAMSGHSLDRLEVVDVRSASGEWALGSRAAMAAARQAAAIGRDWLAVRADERALEGESLAAVRAQEQLLRDHAFSRRQAEVAERARQAALGDAERALEARERQALHVDALTAGAEAHARAMAAQTQGADLAQARQEAQSARIRREAEDEARVEALRRETRLAELRGLAALEADVAEREQRHELERMARLEGKSEAQILAMQASRLAEATHGAAFAEALGKLADGDAARRERERADARLDAKDARTMALLEKVVGAAKDAETQARGALRDVAETTKDMAKTAVASHAQVAAAAARGCLGCGASLAPTARFCGVCGTTVA